MVLKYGQDAINGVTAPWQKKISQGNIQPFGYNTLLLTPGLRLQEITERFR